MNGKKRLVFLIGLIILFGGLDIAILLSHLNRVIGIIMIFVGLTIIAYSLREEIKIKRLVPAPREIKIATRIIDTLTLHGRLKPFFPLVGASIIALVIVFNTLFYGSLQLGSHDLVTILLGIVLIVYNFVPEKFETERCFALLFMVILFLVLVVPLTIYTISYGGLKENSNSPFIYYLLANPVVGLLNILGVSSSAHMLNPFEYMMVHGVPIGGEEGGVYVVFQFQNSLDYDRISIGLSCTGLYSVAIFISAFTSFVSVEYKKVDMRVGALLALGVVTSWIANILRMAIIIVVGSYYGMSALEWTHHNIGEIIFMIWIGIFWWVMFKYLIMPEKRSREPGEIEEEKGVKETKNVCKICFETLKIDVPAMRCQCGAFYHKDCAQRVNKCPVCGKIFTKETIEMG